MVAFAGKKDQLSDDELRRFTGVLRNQRDNPAFAERFATKMGGGRQGLAEPLRPGRRSGPEGDRSKLLGDFQNNLSMTLATAFHGAEPGDAAVEAGDHRRRPEGDRPPRTWSSPTASRS